MSAENWTICPQCEKEQKEEHRKNFEEGYGTLSREEFLETMQCINIMCSKINTEKEKTLVLLMNENNP